MWIRTRLEINNLQNWPQFQLLPQTTTARDRFCRPTRDPGRCKATGGVAVAHWCCETHRLCCCLVHTCIMLLADDDCV
eukprot:551243-Pleurochrysis_carterae.AAC.2